MGKIGDLIVRLKLQYQDYEKGLKKATNSTTSFSKTFGKIKGVALGVWGAIGAGAIKLGKDILASSNQMQDAWEMFTTKAKAGWQSFVRTLVSGDWKNFVNTFKKDIAAAAQLTDALQGNSEVQNSIRILRAQYAEEIAKLKVVFGDTSKSDEERIKAGKKLLEIEKSIYTQGIAGAQKLKDAYYEAFLGPVWGAGTGSNRANQKIWDKMIIAYGLLTPIDELGGRTFKDAVDYARTTPELLPARPGEVRNQKENQKRLSEWLNFQEQLGQWAAKSFGIKSKDPYNWIEVFFTNYEKRLKGEEIDQLVKAIVGLEEAEAAYDEATRKIQTGLGSLTKSKKQQQAEQAEGIAKNTLVNGALLDTIFFPEEVFQVNVPDILPDDWLERNRDKIDEARLMMEEMKADVETLNQAFSSAVAQSLSGATQALIDSIAGIEGADAKQVLAALLEPFASTMISLGEMLLAEGMAIEVFKTSLSKVDGVPAIAAGLSLIALGSALSSGIKALGGATSSSASGTDAASSSAGEGVEKFEQEITVRVVGEISGDKILLAGQKTLNKWER